jgi:hypothetical protein
MIFGIWDILLLTLVSGLAILTAYIENPVRKTFILMIPLPFSVAVMSLGKDIDATNVIALLILNLYYHFVRVLHYRFKVHILPAIILGAALYCVIGAVLAGMLPATDTAFWISCGIVFALNFLLIRVLPQKSEPGNRTALPLYIKVPLTIFIVCIIIVIKKYLLGFMTLFPMVGVFATYETRKSLWTTCRHVPVLSMLLVFMLIIVRVGQGFMPRWGALLLGWAGLLSILIPYFITKSRSQGVTEDERNKSIQ